MAPKASKKYVALLRGINVGGKNKLPMKDLKALFEAAGGRQVQTYIQSGNVVFEASDTVSRAMPKRVASLIEDEFGYHVPVVQRSQLELSRIAERHPFLSPDSDHKKVLVAFLADKPNAHQIASLDPARSPGDDFHVDGREIFLRFPNGVGKSKLTNQYFDRKLGTVSTIRNWRTVLALIDKISGDPPQG